MFLSLLIAICPDVSPGSAPFDPSRLGLLRTLCPHARRVYGIEFSPDGRRLFTCGEDARVNVFRAGTWDLERSIEEHALCLAAGPRSDRIATGNISGSIRVWDLSTGRMLQEIALGTAIAQKLQFSPDGRRLASVDTAGNVRFFDPDSGAVVKTFGGFSQNSPAFAFLPDSNQFVAVREGGRVGLFSASDGELRTEFPEALEPIQVALGRDGKTIASASAQGAIRVMDLAARRELATIGRDYLENMPVVALTEDCRYALGTSGVTLHVFELGSGNMRASLKHHTGAISQIVVKGRYVATMASDSLVKVWGPRPGGMSQVQPKGFLGVVLEEDAPGKCVVSQVVNDSAAERAGIRVGDRVAKIDGTEVQSAWHAVGLIGIHFQGDEIQVVLERDKPTTISVRLGARPPSVDK